jgi:hypothetical protein
MINSAAVSKGGGTFGVLGHASRRVAGATLLSMRA